MWQFGFRPNSSTQEALLTVTRDWHQSRLLIVRLQWSSLTHGKLPIPYPMTNFLPTSSMLAKCHGKYFYCCNIIMNILLE